MPRSAAVVANGGSAESRWFDCEIQYSVIAATVMTLIAMLATNPPKKETLIPMNSYALSLARVLSRWTIEK